MTFHGVRAKDAKGPRISAGFDPVVFKAIEFLSKKWDVPMAEVVRRGMLSYTTPLLYDLAAGREPNFSAQKRPG